MRIGPGLGANSRRPDFVVSTFQPVLMVSMTTKSSPSWSDTTPPSKMPPSPSRGRRWLEVEGPSSLSLTLMLIPMPNLEGTRLNLLLWTLTVNSLSPPPKGLPRIRPFKGLPNSLSSLNLPALRQLWQPLPPSQLQMSPPLL